MAALYRVLNYLGKNVISTAQNRNISLSAVTRIKESKYYCIISTLINAHHRLSFNFPFLTYNSNL